MNINPLFPQNPAQNALDGGHGAISGGPGGGPLPAPMLRHHYYGPWRGHNW